jgi:hypothetical protein
LCDETASGMIFFFKKTNKKKPQWSAWGRKTEKEILVLCLKTTSELSSHMFKPSFAIY